MYPDARRDIGLDGAQQLVDTIYASNYNGFITLPPRVTDGRGRRRACYSPRSHTIKMPRSMRYPTLVCHEVAHAIAGEAGGWHGPRFARLVAKLWEKYLGIPQGVAHEVGKNQRPRKVSFD